MHGLLIGGTSHCGKSTLAHHVGEALGWRVQSTDQLARHPGRPWLSIPAPVEEFYETLSAETIYWFLRVHHVNMWPLLVRTLAEEQAAGHGFVLEGSALRPEQLAGIDDTGLLCVCLFADADFLAERMRRDSLYADQDGRQKRLIDAFITRSLRDNAELHRAALAHGIWSIDVADADGLERETAELLAKLQH